MIQCKKWMSEENTETFYKFIRAECLKEKVEIKPKAALAVYDELIYLARNPKYKDQLMMEKEVSNHMKNMNKHMKKVKV